MHVSTLLDIVRTISCSGDGHNWKPLRPSTAENTFWKYRIRSAWKVLIGKADAIEW